MFFVHERYKKRKRKESEGFGGEQLPKRKTSLSTLLVLVTVIIAIFTTKVKCALHLVKAKRIRDTDVFFAFKCLLKMQHEE